MRMPKQYGYKSRISPSTLQIILSQKSETLKRAFGAVFPYEENSLNISSNLQ